MNMNTYKLSPSDLTFLWDECKRCFYLKVVHKIARPSAPFPAIFTRIDGLMKDFFAGKNTHEIFPGLPPGLVQFGEKWVESQPISLPEHSSICYIRGKFDTVVRFDDSSYGVVDFKTSTPKPTHLAFYGRQLHAYAYALEHAEVSKFSLSPISRLGLLVVEPNEMERTADGRIAYLGEVTWQEVPRDEAAFLLFLGEVMSVLEQPTPPEPAEKCAYCQYRQPTQASLW
jgi:CRISPR/Cas system-associated exonuclease Cas4 (RecB family)